MLADGGHPVTRHDKRDLERAKHLAEILLQYRGGLTYRAAATAQYLFDTPRTRRLYLAILRELEVPYSVRLFYRG
jgi:hypothetical protein